MGAGSKQLPSPNSEDQGGTGIKGSAQGEVAALAKKEPYQVTYRIRTPFGIDKWVWEQGRGVFANNEELIALEGFIFDITARKQAEDELILQRDREITIRAEAEAAKRNFYKGTIFSVTEGKLDLVTYDEINSVLSSNLRAIPLASSAELGTLRDVIFEVARSIEMADARIQDLVTAVGEAAANAIKHSNGGLALIGTKDSVVQVCIQDMGPGMDTLVLPKATLMRQYSTTKSMGLGYSIILNLVDKVYLATEKQGTWVLLEMEQTQPTHEITLEDLPDTW
jgi:anti-sigma regulatory factor (Ser/Thr protein kinase)